MQTSEEIEKRNRIVYEKEYSLSQVSIDKEADSSDYSQKMIRLRLELLRKYGFNKTVLDVGCGTGDFLFEVKDIIKNGVGIDFNPKAIKRAISKKKKVKINKLEFIHCNAKQIPCKDNVFDLIFSFSSLYYIPEAEKVIFEISRLLKHGSIAILEFGNLFSLNTIICNAYPELAITTHIRINDMKKIIKDSGLEIVEWKAFQILPMWGDRPVWMKPFLNSLCKRILQKELGSRMIDEWISNMPVFKKFAFRQTFICKKSI